MARTSMPDSQNRPSATCRDSRSQRRRRTRSKTWPRHDLLHVRDAVPTGRRIRSRLHRERRELLVDPSLHLPLDPSHVDRDLEGRPPW
eukprot:5277668-Pleurochrysis_carterae.AAC.1